MEETMDEQAVYETPEDIAAYAAFIPGLDPARLSEDPDEGLLLAGAFCRAYNHVVDGLFDDVEAVRRNPNAVADNETYRLCQLPEAYQDRYDAAFAQRLLAAAIDLGSHLATGFHQPGSTIQELLVRIVLRETSNVVEAMELGVEDGWFSRLDEVFLTDDDHEMLYNLDPEDVAEMEANPPLTDMVNLAFDEWFDPFNGYEATPYAVYG